VGAGQRVQADVGQVLFEWMAGRPLAGAAPGEGNLGNISSPTRSPDYGRSARRGRAHAVSRAGAAL
jgi:hypothetical protein